MRNVEPLFCRECPWQTPAFRRGHRGVGVSNLGRLREHVATAHASEPTLDSPWEPRSFTVGDLVTVTKQPECPACADYDFATVTGEVTKVDRSIDVAEPSPEPWLGEGIPPEIALRGHYYAVKLDRPIRDLGDAGWLMQLLRGKDYWTDEILAAAAELEAR